MLLGFDMHSGSPAVQRLAIHLEEEQSVTFVDNGMELKAVPERAVGKDTTLLG